MPVIGPERDLPVLASLGGPALLLLEERDDHGRHVGRAAEMVGLMERAVGLAGDIAQVREVDARTELAHHRRQVVLGTGAVRAGAEGQPVRRTVGGREDAAGVLGGRDDARQAEEREGRVVRVDAEPQAVFLRHRDDLAQEMGEVRVQIVCRDALVLAERRKEARAVVVALRGRQAGDQVVLDARHALGAALSEARLGGGQSVVVVVVGSARTLQDEDIVGGEVHRVEAQRQRAVRHRMAQLGAGPVDHRHEVVADRPEPDPGEGAQRILVPTDVARRARATRS